MTGSPFDREPRKMGKIIGYGTLHYATGEAAWYGEGKPEWWNTGRLTVTYASDGTLSQATVSLQLALDDPCPHDGPSLCEDCAAREVGDDG